MYRKLDHLAFQRHPQHLDRFHPKLTRDVEELGQGEIPKAALDLRHRHHVEIEPPAQFTLTETLLLAQGRERGHHRTKVLPIEVVVPAFRQRLDRGRIGNHIK